MTGGISLSGAPAGRWRLEHDGRRLEAETARAGWNRVVRLFVDGEPAGEATTDWLKASVPYGDSSVEVVFDVLGLVDGQAARCDLVPPAPAGDAPERVSLEKGARPRKDADGAEKGGKREKIAFEAPAGTRAARREALARAHPVLYASRHVVAAVGRVVFPLLGLGVLVRMLLRWIPRPDVDVPFPDVDGPSIPWPDVPWPDLPDLPDVSAPPWLAALLATAKFWVPILIAVGVAAREARRRKRAGATREAPPTAPTAPTGPADREGDARPASGRAAGDAGDR
ncbi:hypothetical protein E1264_39830 [Actinomadura sp. KC216]|uniref:hypothetical protein n=1 Tax=Actinomadura sp. KC216 TaxID=2530370 RepID=UPI0010506211|nr:hypothetical protein [Actinomadura sp. KC216]TDB75453.1 hypothetical protein E1264_39830 [Actinomadura sp. KC216]